MARHHGSFSGMGAWTLKWRPGTSHGGLEQAILQVMKTLFGFLYVFSDHTPRLYESLFTAVSFVSKKSRHNAGWDSSESQGGTVHQLVS